MNDCLHPRYYSSSGIEAIDFIDAHGMNFSLANAIKYIVRAGLKYGTWNMNLNAYRKVSLLF